MLGDKSLPLPCYKSTDFSEYPSVLYQ